MITVLLADDNKIVRRTLRLFLDQCADIRIVAEVDDGRSAIRLAQEHKPRIVVMDIAMPDMNGMDATRQILSTVPHLKVLALSGSRERKAVENMLNAGASGYVLKEDAFKELAIAVREVAAGGTYMSPSIAGIVVDAL